MAALELNSPRGTAVTNPTISVEARAHAINPTHEAADAFWQYWRDNGETHRHGYYESTWGAINAALAIAGLHEPRPPTQAELDALPPILPWSIS